MNIHINYIIAVFLGCIFATQAHASDKLIAEPREYGIDSCRNLIIYSSIDILSNYTLVSDYLINYQSGYPINCENEKLNGSSGQSSDILCVASEDFYGPDVIMTFKRKTDGDLVVIRVQQNFCGFEAGAITVQQIRGEWQYRTREGSYGDNQPGKVWLDQVSLNN